MKLIREKFGLILLAAVLIGAAAGGVRAHSGRGVLLGALLPVAFCVYAAAFLGLAETVAGMWNDDGPSSESVVLLGLLLVLCAPAAALLGLKAALLGFGGTLALVVTVGSVMGLRRRRDEA